MPSGPVRRGTFAVRQPRPLMLPAAASGEGLTGFRLHMCGFLHDWLLEHIVRTIC